MLIEDIGIILSEKGYDSVQVEQQPWRIYFKRDGQAFRGIWLLPHQTDSMTGEQYQDMYEKVYKGIYHKGFAQIELFTMIVTDNLEQARNILADDSQSWVVESNVRKLYIYEHQPADYDGLKEPLEALLAHKGKVRRKNKFRIPVCTAVLAAVNIFVFICMFALDPQLDLESVWRWGAVHRLSVIQDGEYYRLFTSMFIHFDFSHLFNNMLMLIFVGGQLESVIGKWKYIVIYIVGGLGGSLLSLYHEVMTDGMALSAGASGAIYALVGALLVVVLLNKGKIAQITSRRLMLLLVGNLYYGFVNTGIDNYGHIGGLVTGIMIALCLYRPAKRGISG